MQPQSIDRLAVTLGLRLQPGERVFTDAQADVGVEIVFEPAGLDQRAVLHPPAHVRFARRVRRAADRHDRAHTLRRMHRVPQRKCAAHRGAAPDRGTHAHGIEPEQDILGLPCVGVVLDALEFLRQAVAPDVGEERMNLGEERLEIGDAVR